MVNRHLSTKQRGLLSLLTRVRHILIEARNRSLQMANQEMVIAYWKVGREIVEEEQRGKSRAEYGQRVIEHLSVKLTGELGLGYSKNNLWYMRQFYLIYSPHVLRQKLHALRGKSGPPTDSGILHALRGELTWTHY